MSSTTRASRGTLSRVAAPIAVFAGALLLAAGAAPALAAEDVEFTLTFADMVPDETRTESAVATLSRDATLVSIEWVERTGLLADAQLEVSVCAGSACASTDAFEPTAMDAGDLDVAVTVEVPGDAPPDTEGTALGRLSFVADDPSGELPETGVALNATVLWGFALIAVGILFAAAATARSSRRREGT